MTKGYDLVVDIDKLLHYSKPRITKINNETLLLVIRDFSVYLKELYYNGIYNGAESKRYRGDWEPVEDSGYRKFLGCEPTDTNILDLIYYAFYIKEKKNLLYIGIDDKVKYPGSSKTLLQVVKAIDKGTSKFNARPVISPVLSYLNSNYKKLWMAYLYKRGVI